MKNLYPFIPTEIPLPYIGILDKSDSELLKNIKKKACDEFGNNSIQYKTIMDKVDINNAKNINFFFTLYLNQNLPKDMRVTTMKDIERILTLNPKYFNDIYCHSSDLLLTSKKSHLPKNKYLLENLVYQVKEKGFNFSIKNPLIISGLELISDNNLKNEYGFLLKINKNSILRNDPNFNWDTHSKSNMLEYYCPIDNEGVGISISGANGREIYANDSDLSSHSPEDNLAIVYDVLYEKELSKYLSEIEKMKKLSLFKIKNELFEIEKMKKKLL